MNDRIIQTSPNPSTEPDYITEMPASLRPDKAEILYPLGTDCMDGDIRALLQALPTKSNIEALILRIEEAHICR